MKIGIACIGVVFILSLPGCANYYYLPTTQNVNVLKTRGDAVLSAGVGDWSSSYALGYAITDHIGVIGNFRTFDVEDNQEKAYSAISWEPEVVFFNRLSADPARATNNIFYSAHLAYGQAYLQRNNTYFSVDASRLSLQPGIGFSNDYFDFALSTRLSWVEYDFTQERAYDQGSFQDMWVNYDLRDVGEGPVYFIEPAVTLGAGYKFIKLRLQAVFAHNLSSTDISYISDTISLSVVYTLNVKKMRNPTY